MGRAVQLPDGQIQDVVIDEVGVELEPERGGGLEVVNLEVENKKEERKKERKERRKW